MRLVKRLVLLAGVMLALSAGLALPASAAPPLPPVKHVWVLFLENENAESTFGADSKAPYLAKTLTAQGAFLPNYYGIGHQSLDNYIATVSGQAPNVQTQADCQFFTEFQPGTIGADGQAIGSGCVYPETVKTVADQLEAKGLSWRGYMEDMGTPCRHPDIGARDQTQSAKVGDQYAARHNPFVYFHSIIDRPTCAQNDVPLTQLTTDLKSSASSPSFGFITPNLCNDGHDAPCVDGQPGGLQSADAFLRKWVPEITGSPAFKDGGALIVTFDEAEGDPGEGDASACCNEQPGPNTPNPGGLIQGPGGGRVGAVVLSPFVVPGTKVPKAYNHYALLRSVEDLFGLDHLGFAGQDGLAAFGSNLWNDVLPAFARFAGLPRKCVASKLKFRYSTGARTTAVTIKIDKKVVRATAKRKARVAFSVRKLKRGKHTVTLRSAIPSGATTTKKASFSRCGA
jgi:phosphatidylinositol-3-phosphatase